jgi:anaphase-promoting complex subunit 3
VASTKRALTFNSKGSEEVHPPPHVKGDSDHLALEGLMSLVAHLASAYQALTFFNLVNCVELFQMLPTQHVKTSWVQSCIGMAYFSAERYDKAVEVLTEVHKQDPHKLESMDYFSSALWQLKKSDYLDVLGLDLKGTCDRRPETWCVLGNAKSAANNQRGALQCFQKAVKIDPYYSYGHVLSGLEQSHLEDMQAATESFMECLAVNPRNFHGWSGVGMVNDAKERYEDARTNYLKALSINPHSSLICCQLGMTLIRLHHKEEGLAYIDKAVKNNPKLPIARFNRSVALQSTGRLEEAVLELKRLAKLCPNEPKIFLQIGKMMYSIDRPQDAIQYFSWALNCDPTNTHVRQEIDSVLQLQGATIRRGPDMSLSGHHSGFQGLEDDDSHLEVHEISNSDHSSMES